MFKGQLGKDMMIQQGYVPSTCTLDPEIAGPLIYSEISKGNSPCDGCNADRSVCYGKPKINLTSDLDRGNVPIER